jgi:hypothetical protein
MAAALAGNDGLRVIPVDAPGGLESLPICCCCAAWILRS